MDTGHSGVKHTARPMKVFHDVAQFWPTPEKWTDTRSSGLGVSMLVDAATSAAAARTDLRLTRGVCLTIDKNDAERLKPASTMGSDAAAYLKERSGVTRPTLTPSDRAARADLRRLLVDNSAVPGRTRGGVSGGERVLEGGA